jgi:manganese/zinc/iron transport system permease protein
MNTFMTQDFPVLMAGVLASIACAVVGVFLVLRRMSLMGDAISHAVLPGIVGAFLVHALLKRWDIPVNLPLLFLMGAVVVGVLTAALSEFVHRLGRVESGASMGVVFTVLFALGVILLEQVGAHGARTIHLDADCVLYGAMENVIWLNAPTSFGSLFQSESWASFPYQVTTLLLVLIADVALIVMFFKEFRISAFDPALAAAQGINPSVMHYLLMTLVALTSVASFEAVGSILVVAMLIVPGLIGHLLTNRLAPMLWLSAAAAAMAATIGYGGAAKLDVNAAGMIGVTLGVLLTLTVLFSPQNGWIKRWFGGGDDLKHPMRTRFRNCDDGRHEWNDGDST